MCAHARWCDICQPWLRCEFPQNANRNRWRTGWLGPAKIVTRIRFIGKTHNECAKNNSGHWGRTKRNCEIDDTSPFAAAIRSVFTLHFVLFFRFPYLLLGFSLCCSLQLKLKTHHFAVAKTNERRSTVQTEYWQVYWPRLVRSRCFIGHI